MNTLQPWVSYLTSKHLGSSCFLPVMQHFTVAPSISPLSCICLRANDRGRHPPSLSVCNGLQHKALVVRLWLGSNQSPTSFRQHTSAHMLPQRLHCHPHWMRPNNTREQIPALRSSTSRPFTYQRSWSVAAAFKHPQKTTQTGAV